METVFDFNPTEEELKALFGSLEDAEKARRDYESTPPKEPDMNIVYLLIGRKQWKKAEQYAQKFDRETKVGCLLPDIDKAKESEEAGWTIV